MKSEQEKLEAYLRKQRTWYTYEQLRRDAGLAPKSRQAVARIIERIKRRTGMQIVKHVPFEVIFPVKEI